MGFCGSEFQAWLSWFLCFPQSAVKVLARTGDSSEAPVVKDPPDPHRYWPEAALPCHVGLPVSRQERALSRQRQVTIAGNLTLEVTPRHFCFILLVRNKSAGRPTLMGRDHAGPDSQEAELMIEVARHEDPDVHQQAQGLMIAAVPPRGNPFGHASRRMVLHVCSDLERLPPPARRIKPPKLFGKQT